MQSFVFTVIYRFKMCLLTVFVIAVETTFHQNGESLTNIGRRSALNNVVNESRINADNSRKISKTPGYTNGSLLKNSDNANDVDKSMENESRILLLHKSDVNRSKMASGGTVDEDSVLHNFSSKFPEPKMSREIDVRENYIRAPDFIVYSVRASFKATLRRNASRDHDYKEEVLQVLQILYANISGFQSIFVTRLRGSLTADFVVTFSHDKIDKQLPSISHLIEDIRLPVKKAMETMTLLGSHIDLPYSNLRLDVGLAELQHTLLNPHCETTVVNVSCSYGYRCGINNNAYVCLHVCVDTTCSLHGICTLTSDWQPMCRCDESNDFVYTGAECNEEIPKIGFSKEHLITIGVGATGTMFFVMFVITCCLWKSRQRARKKANQPGRPSQMLRNLFNFDGLDNPGMMSGADMCRRMSLMPQPPDLLSQNLAFTDMPRRSSMLDPSSFPRRMSTLEMPRRMSTIAGVPETPRRPSMMNSEAGNIASRESLRFGSTQSRISFREQSVTPPPPYNEENIAPSNNLSLTAANGQVDPFVLNAVSTAVRSALEDVTKQIVNPLRSRLHQRESELISLRNRSPPEHSDNDTILTNF